MSMLIIAGLCFMNRWGFFIFLYCTFRPKKLHIAFWYQYFQKLPSWYWSFLKVFLCRLSIHSSEQLPLHFTNTPFFQVWCSQCKTVAYKVEKPLKVPFPNNMQGTLWEKSITNWNQRNWCKIFSGIKNCLSSPLNLQRKSVCATAFDVIWFDSLIFSVLMGIVIKQDCQREDDI